MALLASGVNLDPSLTEQVDPIAKQGRGRLASSLGMLRSRYQADATGAPKAPGGYFDEQLGTAGARGNRNIDNGLYGALGGGAYKDVIGQRDNNQQMELAREYGDMMRPSSLQEALGALGTVGGLGAVGYGLSKNRKPPTGSPLSAGRDSFDYSPYEEML